jgi:hypothetical protein
MRVASVVVLILATCLAKPGWTAPVSLCGPSICYTYDNDALLNPGIVLLGAPTLLGNSDVLKFTPTQFFAESTGPGGASAGAATFRLNRVWSPAGTEIGAIGASAAGDYQILGGGTASIELSLTAVDLVNDLALPGFPESISRGGVFTSSVATGLPFVNWSVGQSINPAEAFLDLATSVSLEIVVRLNAVANESGQGVFLAQKLGLANAAVVPGPGALPLATTGLLTLLGLGRRQLRLRRVRNAGG